MIFVVSGEVIFRVSGHAKLWMDWEPSGAVTMLSPEVIPTYKPVMLSILASVTCKIDGAGTFFLHAKNNTRSDSAIDAVSFTFMTLFWAKIENKAA